MSAFADEKRSANALSRRGFIAVTAAAGGGLMLGFDLHAMAQEAGAKAPVYVLRPNAFIGIGTDGKVTLQIPQEEMGQDVYTTFCQLVAEELDVPLSQMVPVAAPANEPIYGRPPNGRQVTGGSNSLRSFYMPLRKIAASCRAMLVAAAAQQWKVDPATLRTENGQVIDEARGRKLAYGALAARAAKLAAPQAPKLKAEKDFKIIGKPQHRLDGASKGNGTAIYPLDIRLPGMKTAVFSATPVLGGKVGHVDDSGLAGRPGLQLVVLDDIVAVVGPDFWSAKKGLDALKITWNGGPNAGRNSDLIWKEMRAATTRKGASGLSVGDAEKGLTQGMRVDAAYEIPLLAHAAIEPLSLTVKLSPGACEMWGGSQGQQFTVDHACTYLGLKREQVNFHNYIVGGGFGRRNEKDIVVKAIRIAEKVEAGTPVKVVWTREEDMTQGMYRPAFRNTVSASVTAEGKVMAWNHRVAAGSSSERFFGRKLVGGLDRGNLSGILDNIYGVPNMNVEYVQSEPKVNVGSWRGVGHNNGLFAVESMMDELALKAGKDPVAFRMAQLDGHPRLKAALELAAQKSGWGKKLGARRAMGVAVQFTFASYAATIADVEVDENGEIKLHRFTTAVDAGRIVNPDTVTAQIQGGVIFGSTAALYGLITVKDGRVVQTNFNNYRMMRISEAPAVDVHLIDSTQLPGGIGEVAGVAAVPAMVNAIAAATGVRLRTLPIDRDLLAGRKSV